MTAASSVAEGTPFHSRSVVVPQVRALSETVHGVRTHYVEAGEGETLVLLHGTGGTFKLTRIRTHY